MSWEPTTYCTECNEAFDVYQAPEDRVCESCKENNMEPTESKETQLEKLSAVRELLKEAVEILKNFIDPELPDDSHLKDFIKRADLPSTHSNINYRDMIINECQKAIHDSLPNPQREGEWCVHRAWMERGIEVLERLKSSRRMK